MLVGCGSRAARGGKRVEVARWATPTTRFHVAGLEEDRKSTRLNSSHANISYAVFCLKKKKKTSRPYQRTHIIQGIPHSSGLRQSDPNSRRSRPGSDTTQRMVLYPA